MTTPKNPGTGGPQSPHSGTKTGPAAVHPPKEPNLAQLLPRKDLDYSKQLPRGVPSAERPPTGFFPYQSIGPGDVTWYFPLPLDKTNPTGVFVPKGFSYGKVVDV